MSSDDISFIVRCLKRYPSFCSPNDLEVLLKTCDNIEDEFETEPSTRSEKNVSVKSIISESLSSFTQSKPEFSGVEEEAREEEEEERKERGQVKEEEEEEEDIPLIIPRSYVGKEKKDEILNLVEKAELIDDVKYYKPTFQLAEDILIDTVNAAAGILSNDDYYVTTDVEPYPDVDWPTQAEFNIFVGLDKIDKYIETWELHSDWKYYIDLKQVNEYPFTKEYVYEVKFSCPRKEFPVAQATASVYFYIGVSYCNPINSFVDVMFMVESTGSKFYPGHVKFNEKWLELVVDSKMHFFKQIRI